MRPYRTLSLLAVFCLLALLPGAVTAQEPATVTIQPPVTVPAAGETFTTDVTIATASDLLGFQFDVNFDPAQLSVEKIDLGPFLASTGRSPQPLGPDTANAATGRVVYGGFTLGSPDQPGAGGDGVLATITWKVVQPADFTASLSRVQLAGAGGRALPGSDTPVPPSATTAVATTPPAQPSPTTVATETIPTGAQEANDDMPIAVLLGLATVFIVLVVVLVVRRGKTDVSRS